MPLTIPGAWDPTADTTWAFWVQFTDRLGTILGFTEHDRPLSIDISDGNGTIVYEPEAAFGRTAIEARSAGRVGSTDLLGFLDSAGITEEAALAGLYDSALIRMGLVDWTQPGAGVVILDVGELDDVHLQDDEITGTFKSLLDRYNTTKFGDLYETGCIHRLGSQPGDIPTPFANIGCRVQLNPKPWSNGLSVLARVADDDAAPTGSEDVSPPIVNTVQPTALGTVGRFFEAASAGTTGGSEPVWGALPALGSTFNDNGITWTARQALREPATLASFADARTLTLTYGGDAPAEHYQKGSLICTGGANVGLVVPIKSFTYPSPPAGTAIVTLSLPFPLSLSAGSPADTFTLVAGCDGLPPTCVTKFRNLRHWGGFALHAPNNDDVFAIPKQGS